MSVPQFERVVILGHTGFVGRALVSALANTAVNVRGFSSRTLDLRDPAALSALDSELGGDVVVIVCAALTPDRGATLATLSDNFAMVANLGHYLEQRAVRKCVYLSSDAVYPMVDEPVTEETRVEPANLYALAKYTAERVLQYAADAKGFPLLVLRPTAVYGPGDTHGSYGPNRFIRTIVQDRAVRLFGAGEELRDHLYIDDLVRVVVELARSETTGVLNVATGTSRSFGSIVAELRALVPLEFEVLASPRTSPVTHRQFDVARLSAALPELHFTPFRDGLERTFEAARQAA